MWRDMIVTFDPVSVKQRTGGRRIYVCVLCGTKPAIRKAIMGLIWGNMKAVSGFYTSLVPDENYLLTGITFQSFQALNATTLYSHTPINQ